MSYQAPHIIAAKTLRVSLGSCVNASPRAGNSNVAYAAGLGTSRLFLLAELKRLCTSWLFIIAGDHIFYVLSFIYPPLIFEIIE